MDLLSCVVDIISSCFTLFRRVLRPEGKGINMSFLLFFDCQWRAFENIVIWNLQIITVKGAFLSSFVLYLWRPCSYF